MVDSNTVAAPMGNTADEGNLANPKKHWAAPRLARLNGRRAMTGFPGNTSDNVTVTSAILS